MDRGALGLDPKNLKAQAQLLNIKWDRTATGRIFIEKKEEIKKRIGESSPDDADTIMMSTVPTDEWELVAQERNANKHASAKLVGIMEVGGNNMGQAVLSLIRENGGTGPESWCGDFDAHCYRHAGSKVVQRGWAAVRFLGFLTGMKIVSARDAMPGDIVCFTFDHTGLLRRKIDAGVIETVEGNTGRARRRLGLPHRRRRRLHQAPRHQPRRPLRPRHPLNRSTS
jgi:hypothetical protein